MEYNMEKVKLKDVCKIEKGKIGITKAVKGEYPLVVTAEERLSHNEWHFNEPATIVPLVSSTGHGHASIKRLHYADGKYAVGNILATLIPIDHDYLNAKYLYVYLTINKEELLVSQMTGAANVTLTLNRLAEVEIEIPDYATQQKVIKRYEDSESYKNQLDSQIEVRSQLIENLRQQIIQEAIMGKLSEKWRKENPDVESAEILLEKIKAEKKLLIKKGKAKKQKALPLISKDDKPFEIPKGWIWCKLGEISDNIHYGYTASALNTTIGVGLLRITDIQENKVDWSNVPACSITKRDIEKFLLKKGDILIARTGGTIGKSFVVSDVTRVSVFASYLIRITPQKSVSYLYLKYYLESSLYWKLLVLYSKGTGQMNVNATNLSTFNFPLPPLAEQHYVVERIESIFTKLNRIKELNKENQNNTDLLNQVVLKEMFE